MVKGELITLGTAAAALGGAYKLSEFMLKAKRIRDVGPSNAVYVRLIGRVRSDLDEVRRLLSVREVHDALEANPEKSKWVYGCMRDVRGALENITPHTERVASDIDDGRRIGIRHRVYWLVSEKEKLESREKELFVAHQSLAEALGFLTSIEPVKQAAKPEKQKKEKDTHVDIDIDIKRDSRDPRDPRDGPHTVTERVVDREVWVEREGAPRRVEERDVYITRDNQGPPRYEERNVHYEERGPRHHDERDVDIHIHRGGDPRYDQRGADPRYDPRDVDPRYEAQYDDRYEQHDQYERRGPAPYPEERHPQPAGRPPFPEPLGRRPESFEDRVPERETWMQSEARRNQQYAEYGAPQPVGAANFQQLPPNQDYAQREVWIEEKEDFRFDQYGNRLPDRYFQPATRPNRSHL